LDGCPNGSVRTVCAVLPMIDLFENGMAPVIGGALDQTPSFLAAARFLKMEDRRAEAYDGK